MGETCGRARAGGVADGGEKGDARFFETRWRCIFKCEPQVMDGAAMSWS